MNKLAELIETRFPDLGLTVSIARGELTVELPREHLLTLCAHLRDDDEFRFEILIDLCGVDYSQYGKVEWETTQATTDGFSRGVDKNTAPEADWDKPRFAVVYHLLSVVHNQRIRLRTFAEGEPPLMTSVMSIWNVADWYEREAFDMFGILFEGHPDLRRILTDYGFIGHPFRKDFPVSGHVEVLFDEEQKRVVYQPVSIEPRTLVPRVIRHDQYQSQQQAAQHASQALSQGNKARDAADAQSSGQSEGGA